MRRGGIKTIVSDTLSLVSLPTTPARALTMIILIIKPISNNDSRKRKADASSGYQSSQSPASQPQSNVISAAADINPTLANQARKEPSKANDGPARPAKVPRKVKATRELEEGKNKWTRPNCGLTIHQLHVRNGQCMINLNGSKEHDDPQQPVILGFAERDQGSGAKRVTSGALLQT